jgi:hypothetical protein
MLRLAVEVKPVIDHIATSGEVTSTTSCVCVPPAGLSVRALLILFAFEAAILTRISPLGVAVLVFKPETTQLLPDEAA